VNFLLPFFVIVVISLVSVVTVDGNGELSDGGSVYERRQVRAGGLFAGRVDAESRRNRQRQRELEELYAAMKAMRYGRR